MLLFLFAVVVLDIHATIAGLKFFVSYTIE